MEPPGGGSLRAHRGTGPRPCHRRPGRRDRPLRRVGVTPGGRGHRLCPGAPGPARGVAVHSLRTGQRAAAPRHARPSARTDRPLTVAEAVIVATARTPIGRAFNGFWAREITPVSLPDGTIVAKDDGPRPGVTIEAVTALRPVFRPHGRVTPGNCCPVNDGAAAVVIMSDTKARELGLTPLARIVATSVSALSPEIMGYGPVEASRRALARAGMTINDIDLVEINEAFAAQVIPSYRDLGIDLDRLNVNGGAIAVGHPFGMTGARITSTLINSLRFHDKQFGLETMCVGGGQGMALVLERLS